MVCYNCGEQTPNDESIFCFNCNKRYMRSKGHMTVGLLVFILASAGTVASLVNAYNSPDGGFYYILYGAIIFGLIDFLKGISDYRHFSKIVENPYKYEKKDVNDGNINEDALQRYFSHKSNKE